MYDTDGYTDANGNYAAVALGGLNNDTWQVQISSDTSPTNYIFSQPYFDQNGGTNLSVGQAVKIKFTALLATNTISGYLTNNSGNPIAGVGMWANATINSVGYNQNMDTDTNGHYSMNTANGTWTVGVNTCSDCSDGLPGNYFSPPNQTVVISNNNGTANFTALLATNTISGYLKDNNSNAIPGIMIWASATINSVDYFQNVDTATNGDYSLGVINGTWTVGVETGGGSDGLPLNYLQPGNQTVVISNNNGTANFTAIPATSNYITGNVNCNGTNIVDVVVSAYATINGTNYAQYGSTGANGNYSLERGQRQLERQRRLQWRTGWQLGQHFRLWELPMPEQPDRGHYQQQWRGEFHRATLQRPHHHHHFAARRRGQCLLRSVWPGIELQFHLHLVDHCRFTAAGFDREPFRRRNLWHTHDAWHFQFHRRGHRRQRPDCHSGAVADDQWRRGASDDDFTVQRHHQRSL